MKSLIMSAPMVRALLDGRKTVTRRVISSPMLHNEDGTMTVTWSDEGHSGPGFYAYATEYPDEGADTIRPPYREGEIVYIKERWQNNPVGVGAIYAADYGPGARPEKGWEPSLFMPEWASRIKLLITNVTAERLHDITDEDVDAEFLGENYPQDVLPELFPSPDFAQYEHLSHQDIYARLWDSLNAARGYPWESNPWVWRIEFEVIA